MYYEFMFTQIDKYSWVMADKYIVNIACKLI